MKIPYFHVDAFAVKAGSGNPAGVCLLDSWVDDKIMQCITTENNLSETAFLVKNGSEYEIRWFTPTSEINLCGHATLASGYVIFNFLKYETNKIVFNSHLSGKLSVEHKDGLFELDFPSIPPKPCETSNLIIDALGFVPVETLRADDYLIVFENENQVLKTNPKYELLEQLDARGVIVTAKGGKSDFVSRFFCPKYGIREDPVTGSSHCTLIPYWNEKLKKSQLHAFQLSKRGGELFCKYRNNRVSIAGSAICYMHGEISI